METIMKNRSTSVILALVLIACSPLSQAQERPHTINVPLSRPGEPITLDIDLMSARIEVIGEDREDAVFEVTVAGDGQRRIVTPSGALPIRGSSYAIDVEEDDNEISVDSDHRAGKVTVLARVPRQANLSLGTINDGAIIVSNIVGNLELSNTNGPITVRGVTGSVIAESINAPIDVDFSGLDEIHASSFETLNGDITVGLPANAGAQLHLDSGQGYITSDFEVEVEQNGGSVQRDEGRNGTTIRIENVIVAKVNGGGPVLRLKSLHGNMHIRRVP